MEILEGLRQSAWSADDARRGGVAVRQMLQHFLARQTPGSGGLGRGKGSTRSEEGEEGEWNE